MNHDAAPPVVHADDDDVALMSAFAAGDVQAFEWLYRRHHAALYRFVRRLLGRDAAAQADEVFQDTWLRVVHAKDRYVPKGASFRTWLFTLAHHRAIDVLRRSGREVALPESDDTEPFVPEGMPWSAWPRPEDAIDEVVFWRRAGAKLLECLEQLPVAQKTAFLLHHEDGITLDEISRALGIGFETAKSRLRYALSKLRTCMGAHLEAAAFGWRQAPQPAGDAAGGDKPVVGPRRLGARA
jgi:RNA polymerase sigma factor (sigma-70 family)